MHFWIDIENAPQVQYLVPVRSAFERMGARGLITARDFGITLTLMRDQGIPFQPVGKGFGKTKLQKAVGIIGRTYALMTLLRQVPRPDVLVSASRAAALAARRFGVLSFLVCDYEYTDLGLFRLAGSYVLHPEVIDADLFVAKGFPRERVISFPGMKEDLTFDGIDVNAVPAHSLGEHNGLVRVLFRPPAEESHYYTPRSGKIALELLEHLAGMDAAVTIFSPRYPWQREYLGRFGWVNAPILLERPVPFVSLLKSVDLVVSSGGTMLREAAWLGVPAYSILLSKAGMVDSYLQSIGRLAFISSREEFSRLRMKRLERREPPLSTPGLPDRLVRTVINRSSHGR